LLAVSCQLLVGKYKTPHFQPTTSFFQRLPANINRSRDWNHSLSGSILFHQGRQVVVTNIHPTKLKDWHP